MATVKTQVGLVKSSQGTVIARDHQGNERFLKQGDAVYLRETLVTSEGEKINVTMINGDNLYLNAFESYSLAEFLANKGYQFAGELAVDDLIRLWEAGLEDISPETSTEELIAAINALNAAESATAGDDQTNNPPTGNDGSSPFNNNIDVTGRSQAPQASHDRGFELSDDNFIEDQEADTFLTTAVTLNDVIVNEDQEIVYTASVNFAPQFDFTITLSNGVEIFFNAGSFNGSSEPQPPQGEDVYIDAESFDLSITSTSGGGYSAVNTTATGPITINDTIDETLLSLSSDATSITEGGKILYTVNLSNIDNLPVNSHGGIVVTLSLLDSNDQPIQINIGPNQTSGFYEYSVPDDGLVKSPEMLSVSITGIQTAPDHFEKLDFNGNPIIVTINDNDNAPIANNDPGTGSNQGLKGYYYEYKQGSGNPNLTRIAQVIAHTQSNDANAKFIASKIDYGYDDNDNSGTFTNGDTVYSGDLADDVGADNLPSNLKDFLNDDAASLQVIGGGASEEATDGIIQLTGKLQVAEDGLYHLNVSHDDGFVIFIDGEQMLAFDRNTSPKDSVTAINLTAGSHEVVIYYWDQGGKYLFDMQLYNSIDTGQTNIFTENNLSHGNEDSLVTLEDQTIQIDVAANDSDADNDLDVTSVVIKTKPSHGELVVNSDGSVTFTPEPDWYGVYSFTYTIKDLAGNESNKATVTVNVLSVNDAPSNLSITSATVSEEGLPNGIEDTVGVNDTTNEVTNNGVIRFADIDSDSFTFSLRGPSGLKSGGEDVSWKWDSGTKTLLGYTGDKSTPDPVLTIVLGTTATLTPKNYEVPYTVQLHRPIDHSGNTSGVEEQQSINLRLEVSDGSNKINGTINLIVEDDSPAAASVTNIISAPKYNTNLMFVLDESGSMDGDRWTESIEAIENLITRYDQYGDVKIRLITFDGNTEEHGDRWLTVTEVQQYLNTLKGEEPDGATNYKTALDRAEQAFDSSGKLPEGNNLLYFISDGAPNNGKEIDSTREGTWTAFVDRNDINAQAIGIGSSSSLTSLNPIAYDGTGSGGTDQDAQKVNNASNLDALLESSLNIPPVTGLFAGQQGGFGADGGYVQNITVDGKTYSYDPVSQIITEGSNQSSGPEHTITVDKGTLTVNFSTGSYEYNHTSLNSDNVQQVIDYTLRDNDQNSDSGSLTLNIIPANSGADATIVATDNNDIMTGNDGSDTFVFNLAQLDTSGTIEVDTITDFHSGDVNADQEADKLDLSNLLMATLTDPSDTAEVEAFINAIKAEGVGVNFSTDESKTSLTFDSTANPNLQSLQIVFNDIAKNDWTDQAQSSGKDGVINEDDVLWQLVTNGQIIV